MKNYKNFLYMLFLFMVMASTVVGMEEALDDLSITELQRRLSAIECEIGHRYDDEDLETRRQQLLDREDFPYGQLSPRLIED